MEDLDNKWILNASISQECKEKDGNNPVTLGLENMRGVRIQSLTLKQPYVYCCVFENRKPLSKIYMHSDQRNDKTKFLLKLFTYL